MLNHTMNTNRSAQSGFFLIEALVAILIFALGVLGMLAMGGSAVGAQSDARYRTDAAALADALASDIVLNVNRSTLAAFQASLNSYQHRPGGANCAFAGPATANLDAVAWLALVSTVGPGLPGLPGAAGTNQQILVDTSAAGFNRVQITICWQAPSDSAMRRHTLVTYVNGLV